MAKHFTAEFKLEAAKLVVDHGYIYVKVAEAVNVSHSAALPTGYWAVIGFSRALAARNSGHR
jgi:hypothetical protein